MDSNVTQKLLAAQELLQDAYRQMRREVPDTELREFLEALDCIFGATASCADALRWLDLATPR